MPTKKKFRKAIKTQDGLLPGGEPFASGIEPGQNRVPRERYGNRELLEMLAEREGIQEEAPGAPALAVKGAAREIATGNGKPDIANAWEFLIYLDIKGSTQLASNKGRSFIEQIITRLQKELRSYGVSEANCVNENGDCLKVACSQSIVEKFLSYLKAGFEVSGSRLEIKDCNLFIDKGVYKPGGYELELLGIGDLLKRFQYIIPLQIIPVFGKELLSELFPDWENTDLWIEKEVSWGPRESIIKKSSRVYKKSDPLTEQMKQGSVMPTKEKIIKLGDQEILEKYFSFFQERVAKHPFTPTGGFHGFGSDKPVGLVEAALFLVGEEIKRSTLTGAALALFKAQWFEVRLIDMMPPNKAFILKIAKREADQYIRDNYDSAWTGLPEARDLAAPAQDRKASKSNIERQLEELNRNISRQSFENSMRSRGLMQSFPGSRFWHKPESGAAMPEKELPGPQPEEIPSTPTQAIISLLWKTKKRRILLFIILAFLVICSSAMSFWRYGIPEESKKVIVCKIFPQICPKP